MADGRARRAESRVVVAVIIVVVIVGGSIVGLRSWVERGGLVFETIRLKD